MVSKASFPIQYILLPALASFSHPLFVFIQRTYLIPALGLIFTFLLSWFAFLPCILFMLFFSMGKKVLSFIPCILSYTLVPFLKCLIYLPGLEQSLNSILRQANPPPQKKKQTNKSNSTALCALLIDPHPPNCKRFYYTGLCSWYGSMD